MQQEDMIFKLMDWAILLRAPHMFSAVDMSNVMIDSFIPVQISIL
jgi:hypothetical protein